MPDTERERMMVEALAQAELRGELKEHRKHCRACDYGPGGLGACFDHGEIERRLRELEGEDATKV